jgi:hypothetical protein
MAEQHNNYYIGQLLRQIDTGTIFTVISCINVNGCCNCGFADPMSIEISGTMTILGIDIDVGARVCSLCSREGFEPV